MDVLTSALTAGSIATMLLEGIKWIVRKIIKKPDYDFPSWFYTVMIPVLTFVASPLLALLMVGEYVLPADWGSWALELVRIALGSLASLFVYENTIKKYKEAMEAM